MFLKFNTVVYVDIIIFDLYYFELSVERLLGKTHCLKIAHCLPLFSFSSVTQCDIPHAIDCTCLC